MNHDSYPDDLIRRILKTTRTIALVGASANDARPSYFVLKYLMGRGYRMLPVNPGLAGQEILGAKVYGSLAEIPEPIDMVEIFRNSQAADGIVDEALALDPLPKVIWMQLSVRNDAAAARAEAKGITVIMNGTMRAYGEVVWPLVVIFLAMYPARLGFYFLAYPHIGPDAVWWTYPAGSAVSTSLTLLVYLRGGWRKRKHLAVPKG